MLARIGLSALRGGRSRRAANGEVCVEWTGSTAAVAGPEYPAVVSRPVPPMQALHFARRRGRASHGRAPCSRGRGCRFAAGFEVDLVGGSGATRSSAGDVVDLDFATDALPEQMPRLLSGWADAIWDVGARFGTIGAEKDGLRLEFTTYRSDRYEPDSRKPDVAFRR